MKDFVPLRMVVVEPFVPLQGGDKRVIEMNESEYRIRKLTPKECWRLMGFTDQDFEKSPKCRNVQHPAL